jgi:hypothetical protein
MFSRPRSLARFLIIYRIGPRSYQITLPGQSAAAVRQGWTSWHRGATLLSVVECDANGLLV